MNKNNSDTPKKLVVTLDKNATDIPSYELVLLRGDSECLEIQLAKKAETDTEINVHVESIFHITKDAIPHFVRQFTKYLQDMVDKQDAQG